MSRTNLTPRELEPHPNPSPRGRELTYHGNLTPTSQLPGEGTNLPWRLNPTSPQPLPEGEGTNLPWQLNRNLTTYHGNLPQPHPNPSPRGRELTYHGNLNLVTKLSNFKLSTLNFQLSTLNLQPSTFTSVNASSSSLPYCVLTSAATAIFSSFKYLLNAD